MFSISSQLLVVGVLFTKFTSMVNAAAIFPPPSGPFNTSLTTAKLVDSHRNDPYSTTPSPRALMVSIFQPITPTQCSPIEVDYMPALTSAFQDNEFGQYGIPAGTFESLQLQVCKPPTTYLPRGSSSRKSCGIYPLLIFSPGNGRTRLLYNAIAQQISSFGYIVVTVDHPYDVDIVTFPDNTTIQAIDIETDAQITFAVGVRRKDVSFVLDQLLRLSVARRILTASAIDISKVGIFGHSLGGATAAETMLYDRRFLGGINLDGSMFGNVIKKGLDRPFFIFAHEGKNRTTDATWGAIWPNLKGWKNELMLTGSAHGTFTDFPDVLDVLGLAGSLPSEVEELLGSINAERALEIVTVYVTAFFDRVLKGKKGSVLDGPSKQYPEVSFATN